MANRLFRSMSTFQAWPILAYVSCIFQELYECQLGQINNYNAQVFCNLSNLLSNCSIIEKQNMKLLSVMEDLSLSVLISFACVSFSSIIWWYVPFSWWSVLSSSNVLLFPNNFSFSEISFIGHYNSNSLFLLVCVWWFIFYHFYPLFLCLKIYFWSLERWWLSG